MIAPSLPTPGTDARPTGASWRVALEYAVRGDLRHLSHHDELRMLRRALTRAQWPVAYSRGFNPLPRLSVPLPRSVGMASDCQLALVELLHAQPHEALLAALAASLPEPCQLKQLVAPACEGAPQPLKVEYAIELDPLDAGALGPGVRRLLSLEQLVVERQAAPRRPARSLNIRPYMERMEVDGSVLWLKLRCEGQRTARPTEIMKELGLAAEVYAHRVRRTQVLWNKELAGAGGVSAAWKGLELGRT